MRGISNQRETFIHANRDWIKNKDARTGTDTVDSIWSLIYIKMGQSGIEN